MAVVGVQQDETMPYAGGRAFGPAGPAILRRFRLTHAVDPVAEVNRAVVDLDLAERDAAGLVRFEHDVVVVQPADPAARNGWALVDVANRGGPTASAFLQQDDTPFFPQPEQPPPGDGHLLAAGWTLAFTGWQFDIAQPTLLGLRAPVARRDGAELAGPVCYTVRAQAGSTRLPLVLPGHRPWPMVAGTAVVEEDGVVLAPGEWSVNDRGDTLVRPGGFRAGSWYTCRFTTPAAVVGGCGLLALRDVAPWLRDHEGMRRTVLFGISQSGRVIRQFLHDGLNADGAGRPAYDAVMPIIAGGRRGQFNRRHAVPGTLPFDPAECDADPTYGSLLARAGAPLKVMAVNTSGEYWRGDAAALAPDDHPDVRVHLVAGTQHSPGYLPQIFELRALGWKGRHGFNTVDYRPVLRAVLAQLQDWVDAGVSPEPSTAPHPAGLPSREAVLARFAAAGIVTPRAGSFPEPAGPVPPVDADGNEQVGILLPDVAAPVGVHTGWNVRHPDMGAPDDELFLVGSTWWLADRPSLEEHRARVAEILEQLVARRFVLAADAAAVRARAERAWHAAAAAGQSSPGNCSS